MGQPSSLPSQAVVKGCCACFVVPFRAITVSFLKHFRKSGLCHLAPPVRVKRTIRKKSKGILCSDDNFLYSSQFYAAVQEMHPFYINIKVYEG